MPMEFALRSSPPQVAVIGGGPAGLMAAEVLATAGAGVTVYDRMSSPGRKFLLAGRGGLNLTHSEEFERFLSRYGPAAPYLRGSIEALPARGSAGMVRGSGPDDLRRIERAGLSYGIQGLAAAARMAATTRRAWRALPAAAPLDRLER